LPKPLETLLTIAVAVLLVLSIFEYFQISALQADVSTLPRGFPDNSPAIFQLQQQVSTLEREISSFNGKIESYNVTRVCVSASHGCAGGSVLLIRISNNGTVAIPYSTLSVNLGGSKGNGSSNQPQVYIEIQIPTINAGSWYDASINDYSGQVQYNYTSYSTATGKLPYSAGQIVPYFVTLSSLDWVSESGSVVVTS